MTKQYIKTNNLTLLCFKKVNISQKVFPYELTLYLYAVHQCCLERSRKQMQLKQLQFARKPSAFSALFCFKVDIHHKIRT